jgi:hypothetical protein
VELFHQSLWNWSICLLRTNSLQVMWKTDLPAYVELSSNLLKLLHQSLRNWATSLRGIVLAILWNVSINLSELSH